MNQSKIQYSCTLSSSKMLEVVRAGMGNARRLRLKNCFSKSSHNHRWLFMLCGMVTALLCFPATTRADLASGLVASYSFTGNANDQSGNGNNGTAGSALVLTQDRFGNANSAYDFNGQSGSYVLVADSPSLHVLNNASIAVWVKPQSSLDLCHIVSKDFGNGGTCFHISVPTVTGYPEFGVGVWGTAEGAVSSPVSVSGDQWHFLVGSYDGSMLSFYLDSQLVNSVSYTGGLNTDNGKPLVIGQKNYLPKPDGADCPFTGVIDDVRIYNRALSAAEVLELYTVPEPGTLTLVMVGVGIFSLVLKLARRNRLHNARVDSSDYSALRTRQN